MHRTHLANHISSQISISLKYSTADGLLMQLAYLFTPKGLCYFRGIFSILDRMSEHDHVNKEDLKRRHALRDALMRKFMDLYD